jgi:hypothetical protein
MRRSHRLKYDENFIERQWNNFVYNFSNRKVFKQEKIRCYNNVWHCTRKLISVLEHNNSDIEMAKNLTQSLSNSSCGLSHKIYKETQARINTIWQALKAEPPDKFTALNQLYFLRDWKRLKNNR